MNGAQVWLLAGFLSISIFPAAGQESSATPAPSLGQTTTNLLKAKPLGPPVDNARCFVCHLNYADEPFAIAHAAKGVGCSKCHGSSDAHCADENNITAPDIMYPRKKTPEACIACHEGPQVIAVPKHKPELEAIAFLDKVCTDCHVQHRLPRRNRNWNRVTGKLLPLPPQPPGRVETSTTAAGS